MHLIPNLYLKPIKNVNELYGELWVCFAKKKLKMKLACSGKDTHDLRFCCTVASPPQNFSLNSFGITVRPFQQYMLTKTVVMALHMLTKTVVTTLHKPIEKFEITLLLS
jgi:hypothetical protein